MTLVKDAVDVAGRPAFALGILEDGWIHNDLLLDRKSYAYLGERSITTKDRTISADDRGDGKVRLVKKGTIQLFLARLAAGVVNAPGQRP